MIDLLTGVRNFLQDKSEPPVYVSDRRFMKAINLLQVAAYADGRDEVRFRHLCSFMNLHIKSGGWCVLGVLQIAQLDRQRLVSQSNRKIIVAGMFMLLVAAGIRAVWQQQHPADFGR